jgi:hypothetical protein
VGSEVDDDEDGEESGEIFMKMRSWLFLPSQQFSVLLCPSRRVDGRTLPAGRFSRVDNEDGDATAYAVEPILREDLGETLNLG